MSLFCRLFAWIVAMAPLAVPPHSSSETLAQPGQVESFFSETLSSAQRRGDSELDNAVHELIHLALTVRDGRAPAAKDPRIGPQVLAHWMPDPGLISREVDILELRVTEGLPGRSCRAKVALRSQHNAGITNEILLLDGRFTEMEDRAWRLTALRPRPHAVSPDHASQPQR